MVALAVWGLAIVRGLTRFLDRITYRADVRPHPHFTEGLERLKSRTDPWK